MYHRPLFAVSRAVFVCSALINIILILTLWAAEDRTRSACHKGLQTMLADTDGLFRVGQHEAEHHLYPKHKGVVAPHVGAWIEIWIEMMIIKYVGFITPTHPMRVCGLK